LQTRPTLTVILLDGVSEWLKGGTLSQYDYKLRYYQLIQEQNDIGWRHIFNGRLSLQWSELQGDYLCEINNKEKSLSGTLWTSAIIQEIWCQWQVVWTQRNQKIHGHDDRSRSAALRRRAKIMLHNIYSRTDFMMPSDRDKIHLDDIEHHLAKSTNQIMNWISVHKPLISHSIKETDRLAI
jgi:hypothetical protein